MVDDLTYGNSHERVREEILHLRKLSFRALKYFCIATEQHSILLKRYDLEEEPEYERMLKIYYRKLMKRFHPDVRRWTLCSEHAPSLEDVRRHYDSRDLHWLVWADLEYGIAPLELYEQSALLEKTIADFAYAIRRIRVKCHHIRLAAQGWSDWTVAA